MVQNTVSELIKVAGHPDVSVIVMRPKYEAFDVDDTHQDALRMHWGNKILMWASAVLRSTYFLSLGKSQLCSEQGTD